MLSASTLHFGIWLVGVVVPHTYPSAANPTPPKFIEGLRAPGSGLPLLSSFLRQVMFQFPRIGSSGEYQSLRSPATPVSFWRVPPLAFMSSRKVVKGLGCQSR